MAAAPPPDYRSPPWLEWIRRNVWVLSFVLGAVTLTVIRPCTRHVPPAPEVLFALPEFELVDHGGDRFSRASMMGKVWVASFVFTSCPSTCPAVTQAMSRLDQRLRRSEVDVELVSFSVDPERDTPEVLLAYARQYELDLSHWTLVTGSASGIRDLIEDGFHLAVGAADATEVGELYDIAHSTKLALVDSRGRVRGFYGIDEDGLDEVYHRAQHVLRDERREGLR